MTKTGKVRWGILGAAGIAIRKVIPAMKHCELAEVTAIASRDSLKSAQAANSLQIPKAYGSYEELLADPDIDVIYNPLPNHLHVPWSIRAAEAGKHVLCEKPIGLNAAEGRQLAAVEKRSGVRIGEAFMVRTHPQWLRTREIAQSGEIGELRAASGFFSYYNVNPDNIRNIAEIGGGGLMDIGCYPIFTTRFIFGEEPRRALGLIYRDPKMKTDTLTSAILDFPAGQAVFTCSTQLVPYQTMQFFGTKGRVQLEIPFNAPPDRPTRIFIDNGADLFGGGRRTEEFLTCDQYTIQGDEFSRAVRDGLPLPVPLEQSVKNMAVIDAIIRSTETGHWETVES